MKTGVRKILDVVTDNCNLRTSCFQLSVIMSKCLLALIFVQNLVT